jgi:hypothetical protein
MKPFGIVLVLFLAPISFAAAPAATQPSLEKENAALKARVAELEANVAQLQQEVKQLRAAPPSVRDNLIVPGPYRFNFKDDRYGMERAVPIPQPQTAPYRTPYAAPIIPPSAVPQQFNGQPFYLIPLKAEKAEKEAEVAK